MSIMNVRANTYALAATTSSQSITLTPEDAQTSSIIVKNTTTGIITVTSSNGAITAVTPASATVPVPCTVFLPNEVGTYTKNIGHNTIAIIAAVAGNVYVQAGSGE